MFSFKKLFSSKPIFIIFGAFNVVVFHYAIFRLWFFLYDSSGRQTYNSLFETFVINSFLVAFFTLPHSFLLQPSTKKFFYRFFPEKLYPSLYSLHASLAIILMDKFWGHTSMYIYQLEGKALQVWNIGYGLSWVFMIWTMYSTGFFRQSGIEHWWKGLRGKRVTNKLLTQGPYSFCRHPIYASFLAMIWTTPNMSFGHLYVSVLWTVYIFVGAQFKEQRLMRNKAYRRYSENVPAFPILPKRIDKFLTNKIWRVT